VLGPSTAVRPPSPLPSEPSTPSKEVVLPLNAHPGDNHGDATTDDGINFGSGVELSTLLSLPSLVDSFSALPPNLQTYALISLLRRSPVPVLQSVTNIIAPALKRDFLSDLPPELGVQILCYLDSQTLCRCTRVCRSWRRLVDGEGKIWRARLHEEGLWIGGGSEEDDMRPRRETEQAQFLRRWNSDCWDEDFDLGEAARPTAEKVSEVVAAAEAERCRRQATPPLEEAEDEDHVTVEDTPPSPVDGIHPLKHVFRSRFQSRKRWASAEPRRIPFNGPGPSVVTCLQFDPEKIVSASDDETINVFSTGTGRTIRQLQGHSGGVWALEYIGNVLISGSTDRTVRVWDLDKGTCTHVFVGHTSTVRCLQIIKPVNVNPDPRGPPVWEPPYPLIVTGSRDWTLRVWKLPYHARDAEYHPYVPMSPSEDPADPNENPFHLRLLAGHRHAVRALAAHGRLVVSGSYDQDVRVWDALSGECTQRLVGHTQKVYSVVLDAPRRQCASGSMDGTVRLWNVDSGDCLRTLEGHTSLVGLLGLTPNFLVSAAADSTLRVWDPSDGSCRHVLAEHQGAITCFQHDEQKVISGSDGTLKMWDVRTGAFVRDLLDGLTGVWQVGFDDRFCVAAVQRNGQSEFHILDLGAPDPVFEEDDDDAAKSDHTDRNATPTLSDETERPVATGSSTDMVRIEYSSY
jgi:F-box and WD-40 domain protein CDC4